MRFIYLEPNIRNEKCFLRKNGIDNRKIESKENKKNIYIIIDYDKNFYNKNTVKLLNPVTFEQFWVNHKDISLL